MQKTTIYLPGELKARVARVARSEGRSEAAVIREALDEFTRPRDRPRPTMPLFSSDDPLLAERDEELLHGFGED